MQKKTTINGIWRTQQYRLTLEIAYGKGKVPRGDLIEEAMTAAYYTGKLGKDATRELIRTLCNKNSAAHQREWAARLLGLTRDCTIMPQLIKALEDKDAAVRLEVVKAIGSILAAAKDDKKMPEWREKLMKLSQCDPFKRVRREAKIAFKIYKTSPEERLLDSLFSEGKLK